MMETRESASPCRVILRGGASIVHRTPVFSPDSRCLVCCSGDTIKVLSVNSGECVRELQGHSGSVTGLLLNPDNPYQLLSCSEDKTLLKWDYNDGVLLKSYHSDQPFVALHAAPAGRNHIFATVQISKTKFAVAKFHLPKDTASTLSAEQLLLGVQPDDNKVAIGYQGTFVAAVQPESLVIYAVHSQKTVEHWLTRDKARNTFSCVACHPKEQCVATGLSDGKILLWYNIHNQKKVVKSVHHWHSLQVQDICFTADGSFFLSGGHECVLVKWQTDSHHRDFKPRLGAPIVHLAASPDNTHYVTCHSDNSIQVMTSGLHVVQAYEGFTQGHLDQQRERLIPAGLTLDPRSGAIVTNGRPGHLQFYNIHSDKQLFNLDVVGHNYISPESLQRPLAVTDIEAVAFAGDGQWLVTVERWDDGQATPDIRLKFWQYREESQSFTLNTMVTDPHRAQVNTLKFRPPQEDATRMVVSTSYDGKFKLWSLGEESDSKGGAQGWACDSEGFYCRMPAGCADFAEDGSLLAVGFGSLLTLWDPDDNAMQTSLHHGDSSAVVSHVVFGRKESCHLVTTTTDQALHVWTVLSGFLLWKMPLRVDVLVASPVSNVFAVLTVDRKLHVFRPESVKRLFTMDGVSDCRVRDAIFVPRDVTRRTQGSAGDCSWQDDAQLFILNTKQELLTVTTAAESKDDTKDSIHTVLPQNLPQTLVSQLVTGKARRRHDDRDPPAGSLHSAHDTKYLQKLLTTPAHVLPPVSTLCLSFLHTLLGKDQADRRTDPEDSDEDDPDEPREGATGDSDTDVQGGHSGQKPGPSAAGPCPCPSSPSPSPASPTDDEFALVAQTSFDWLS